MCMMLSIFGDDNFSNLLCYICFAPSEQLALEWLEVMFSHLQNHNLKLFPKICYLLRRSVEFLGLIIFEDRVKTDLDII